MKEQIKCIKSSRMLDEKEDSFTEGKIYMPFSYVIDSPKPGEST